MTAREISVRKRTSYIFREKELRDLLGLAGRIIELNLWSGLTPDEEKATVSSDKVEWEVVTEANEVLRPKELRRAAD